MYNLFVTYTAGQWDKSAYEYRPDRVIRVYTDDYLRERFGELDADAISELISYPSLFAYEEHRDDTAYLGWLKRIMPRSGGARIEFELEEALAPLSREAIKAHATELDIGNLELTTTHWAVKDVDLLPTLIKCGVIDQADIERQPADSRLIQLGMTRSVSELRVRPTVFRVPAARPEPDLVSVMMPFEMSFKPVYNTIKEACKDAKFRSQRTDDIWDEAEVIQDVFSLIYRSRIVICDFSGRNSNVFYEAGIAHTLGKTVVPIVQNKDDIPFDLRHLRYIPYLDNHEGRAALRADVTKKLQLIAGTGRESD